MVATLSACITAARGSMTRPEWARSVGLVGDDDLPRSVMARWEEPHGPVTGRWTVPLLRASGAPPETWLVELAARLGVTADDAHALAVSGNVVRVAARFGARVHPVDVAVWLETAARATVTKDVAHAVDTLRALWLARPVRTHR